MKNFVMGLFVGVCVSFGIAVPVLQHQERSYERQLHNVKLYGYDPEAKPCPPRNAREDPLLKLSFE